MICKKCGEEGGCGRFCSACGARMVSERVCPACGARAEGRFCSDCGAKLDGDAPKKKKVSLLGDDDAFAALNAMADSVERGREEAAQRKKQEEEKAKQKLKELWYQGDRHLAAEQYQQAIACYRAAAEGGFAKAWMSLAWLYTYPALEQYADAIACYLKYEEYLRTTGEGQIDSGLYELIASCHERNGDYAEAKKYYEKAANLGSLQGMLKLGEYYCDGKGVSRNREQAEAWYRKAGGDWLDFKRRKLDGAFGRK